MKYLPCELHCHTNESDGSFTFTELLENAEKSGLALIAITDHNTKSGAEKAEGSAFPFIDGIEWTTFFGHMLVLSGGFVDWRDADIDNIDEKIAAVKALGGLVGIAHPFQLGAPFCTGGRWEFKVKNYSLVDYVEVWHDIFTPDSAENRLSLAFWTSLLDNGHHLGATYGRDWHSNQKQGHFCRTYLGFDGKADRAGAYDAIEHMRTVVSAGPLVYFTAESHGSSFNIGQTIEAGRAKLNIFYEQNGGAGYGEADIKGEKIRIVTNGSRTAALIDAKACRVSLELKERSWYRLELYGTFNGQSALLAVTSPIYTA